MKRVSLFVFLLLFSFSSVACELFFKTENLCLSQKWTVKPTRTSAGKMTLTFTDGEGRILSPKNDPFVLLWMPSMGHGSTPVTMEQVSDGVYSVTNVKFIMGGAWDIRYQLKDGSRVVEEKIQKISL